MTKRYPIWKKDDFFDTNFSENKRVDMDAEVVKVNGEVPILSQFDNTKPIIGVLGNFEVEDGDLTAEIVRVRGFDPEILEDENVRFGGSFRDVEFNEDKSKVLSCEIMAVSIMLNIGFPKE